MSINVNTNIHNVSFNQAQAAVRQQEKKDEKPILTITNAPVSNDDGIDINVPQDALSRTDKLGNAIASAFNLPAPPMPKFETE